MGLQQAHVVLVFVEGDDDCSSFITDLSEIFADRANPPVHWFLPKWDRKTPSQREGERGAIRRQLTAFPNLPMAKKGDPVPKPVGFESDPNDFMFDSLPEPTSLRFNEKDIPMPPRAGG